MREAMKTGGELSTLSYRERKPGDRLVISPTSPARWTSTHGSWLQFLYACRTRVRARVETFVFATG
jgi:uncharacterized protein with von Willebrand factor type A (vWA) domain